MSQILSTLKVLSLTQIERVTALQKDSGMKTKDIERYQETNAEVGLTLIQSKELIVQELLLQLRHLLKLYLICLLSRRLFSILFLEQLFTMDGQLLKLCISFFQFQILVLLVKKSRMYSFLYGLQSFLFQSLVNYSTHL